MPGQQDLSKTRNAKGERECVCVCERERVESNVGWRADCAVLTRVLGRCRVWAVECERRDFVGDRRQG